MTTQASAPESPTEATEATGWPHDHPLSHIWRTENGLEACNTPFVEPTTGQLSGYCDVQVAHWDRWRRPAHTHRGDHRIAWPNTPTRGQENSRG